MKIRTKAEVDRLDQKIKSELGVDCNKYRNDRVVERFVEILVFVEYVFTSLILSILLAVLLYLVGFFVLDLSLIQYFIYGFFGGILFLVLGFFGGILLLTSKMKSDLNGIITYTFEMMKTAIKDVNQFGNQTTNSKAENLKLLFKGMIHIVTIPTLVTVIATKMPLIGFVFSRIIKRVFILVSDRISFKEENTKAENYQQNNEVSTLKYEQTITNISSGITKTIHLTFGLVQFPLKVIVVFIAIILLLFLYAIH